MTKPVKHSFRRSKPIDWDRFLENGSEDAHQIRLFAWAAQTEIREQYPELKWMFHIPNGGSRHKGEAGKLKAMGVKSGVPDICLPVHRGRFAGLWIELKRPKDQAKRAGQASDLQIDWIKFLRDEAFGAVVCLGWENARDIIVQYLTYKEG